MSQVITKNVYKIVLVMTVIIHLAKLRIQSNKFSSLCEIQQCNCSTPVHSWLIADCIFDDNEIFELGEGSYPPKLLELYISGGKWISLWNSSFSKDAVLTKVLIRNSGRVIINRHAFARLNRTQFHLDLSSNGLVVIKNHAFRFLDVPLQISISYCPHVLIQNSAFSWLLKITIVDVRFLELMENAFAFQSLSKTRHGSATNVVFQKVIIPELPQGTFPSSLDSIYFEDVEVRNVRTNAFNATVIHTITFQNTSLHNVERDAFSYATYIVSLVINDVRLHLLAAGAVKSAVNNLTIQHSKLSSVKSGAVNVVSAYVQIINNEFLKLQPGSFVFNDWNQILINNNSFSVLESDTFIAPFPSLQDVKFVFGFENNVVEVAKPGSLGFIAQLIHEADGALNLQISNNKFSQPCQCNISRWLFTETLSKKNNIEFLFDSSQCFVNSVLARCFDINEGFVELKVYYETVCGANDILCKSSLIGQDSAVSVFDSDFEILQHDRKVLELIFIVVCCAVMFILIVTLILWMNKKGYCFQMRLVLYPSTAGFFRIVSQLCGGGSQQTIVSATSISRLPVDEYQGTIVVEEVKDPELETLLYEDKWTQTLPEELTQELLQTLREKLDDPENYSEARDLIEHLYDLIKVEESCSNNNASCGNLQDIDGDDGDNLYDFIRPITEQSPLKKMAINKNRNVCSVGTRAPSPDKLLPASPYSYVKQNRENHIYAELNETPQLAADNKRGPSRPRSFLKSLGETFLGQPRVPDKSMQGISLLCEYAEPTDVAHHEYSELPMVMANRPLPTKPQDDPGEGTSSSSK